MTINLGKFPKEPIYNDANALFPKFNCPENRLSVCVQKKNTDAEKVSSFRKKDWQSFQVLPQVNRYSMGHRLTSKM